MILRVFLFVIFVFSFILMGYIAIVHAETTTTVTTTLDVTDLVVTDPTAFTLTGRTLTVRDGHHAPLVCDLLVDTFEEERGTLRELKPLSTTRTTWDVRRWRILCPATPTPLAGTFTFERTTIRRHERTPLP